MALTSMNRSRSHGPCLIDMGKSFPGGLCAESEAVAAPAF